MAIVVKQSVPHESLGQHRYGIHVLVRHERRGVPIEMRGGVVELRRGGLLDAWPGRLHEASRLPRDPDDPPLDELGIERSDLGLDPDKLGDDRIAERQRKEDSEQEERQRVERERDWKERTLRLQDALKHIATKLGH